MSWAGNWSYLPHDLLRLILENIKLVNDIKRFGVVCKQWNLVAADHLKNHICFGSQWLVKKKLMELGITLYHPLAENPCHIRIGIPQMRGASILSSRDGWLLMSKGCEIFFLSPFSKSIIKLPNLPHCGVTFTSFTFTYTPTSKDWQICGLIPYQIYDPPPYPKRKFGIFTIGYGDKHWMRTLGTVPRGFFVTYETNPVYHNGRFYFICTKGALGVLDPETHSWKLLAPELPPGHKLTYNGGRYYLLECDGELFTIFNRMIDSIKVLQLDESKMIWKEINDIGEHTFFLSERTSYARKSTKDYMRNKLFSHTLYENYGVFYCLENSSFQTFGNDLHSEELKDTTVVFESCWMEPTQHDLSKTAEWLDTVSFDQCALSDASDTDDNQNDNIKDEDDVSYRTEDEDEECLNIFRR